MSLGGALGSSRHNRPGLGALATLSSCQRQAPLVVVACETIAAVCALGSPAARSIPAPVAADAGSDLTWLGDTGGNLAGIAATTDASGDRLFVAAGARIEVYDTSDPDRPVRIGEIPQLPGVANLLAIEGTRLYVDVHQGLYIFDIAEPAAPQILGRLPGRTTPSWCWTPPIRRISSSRTA